MTAACDARRRRWAALEQAVGMLRCVALLEVAWVPACAGMTVGALVRRRGAGVTEWECGNDG